MQRFDLDPTRCPQDDLFRHVNGRWLADTEIPDDKSRYGAFIKLRDQADEAVREIVADCLGEPGSVDYLIRTVYDDFMDEDAVEATGLDGLRDLFTTIDEINSYDDLWAFFAYALRLGITVPIGGYVDSDPDDPTQYRFTIDQDGLGLPDEEYYRLDGHAETRAKYLAHVARMLALGGFGSPTSASAGSTATGDEATTSTATAADPTTTAAAAAEILALETRIAAAHWDKIRCRDLVATHNPRPLSQVGPPWAAILVAAGVGSLTDTQVIVAQPSFLTDLSAFVDEIDLETWRNYLRWHTLSTFAGVLPRAFVDESFDFYSRTLSGVVALKPRWKRGVDLVESLLGEAIGKVYVARHYSTTAQTRMNELVTNLLEAYRISISQLPWMTEATRAEALTKLSKFRAKIGYPAKWRDYSGLDIRPGDLVGNVIRASLVQTDEELAKLAEPVRDWEWFMTPQTVNAYYHPLRNEIVFPAAILQPPFFDESADDAVNYGAIGAVIGHEIGHGFDDQGSTCDGDGRLRDWWLPADREAFEALAAKLIAQYSELAPAELPDVFVNGELTVGENIGDLGGLTIAYLAWKLSCHGVEPELIDGQTGEQRFFYAWALTWQEKIRPEALREQIATDPHSPDEFRCNQVVRNVDAFYSAFEVSPGDALWLAPKDRVKIW